MKKNLAISAVLASALSLSAGTIPVNTGWNLVGAVDDINPSTVNCAKTIWTYNTDGTWNLYQNINSSDNFGFNPLTNIEKGVGFWVNSTCNTSIGYDDNATDTSIGGFNQDILLGNTFYIVRDANNSFAISYDTTYGTREYYPSFDLTNPTDQNYTIDTNGDMIVNDGAFTVKLLSANNIYANLEVIGTSTYYQRAYFNKADAEAYLSSLAPTTDLSDINMTTTLVNTLKWGDFDYAIDVEDNDYYSVWNINADHTAIAMTGYNFDNGNWEQDDDFNVSITNVNTDYNISATATDGTEVEMLLLETKQITDIEGISFSDLYATDIEIHVVTPGNGWTDTWDWAPTYYNGSEDVNVSTNDELLDMFLTTNSWFDNKNYAMLDANGTVVSGYISGTFVCDKDNDGENDDICENIVKTGNSIGHWTYDSTTNGISIELPNEFKILSLVSDSNSPTGYYIEEHGTDKAGAVWKETLYTGSYASESLAQQFLGN